MTKYAVVGSVRAMKETIKNVHLAYPCTHINDAGGEECCMSELVTGPLTKEQADEFAEAVRAAGGRSTVREVRQGKLPYEYKGLV